MPASRSRYDQVRLGWTPGIWRVLIEGSRVSQDRIYCFPLCLDRIFTYKECRVTFHGISKEALIGLHLVAGVVVCYEFHFFAAHFLTRYLRSSSKRDQNVGVEAKADKIGMRRFNLSKHRLRWALKLNQYLGGRHGQPLPGPYVKWYACPTPGMEMKFDRGTCLNL